VLEITKSLSVLDLVERKPLPSQIQRGSVPYVYWLSAQGRHYLESLPDGYDFSNWRYPSEMNLAESSHLWHALDVNDFLIAGARFAEMTSDITQEDMKHDLVMQMTMKLPVKSDGWQLFHIDKIDEIEEQAIWLELDRGKESEKQWRDKVERLLMYAKYGTYADDFGTPVMTVAVVVPSYVKNAARRISLLKLWTEKQLTAMGLHDEINGETDLFRFLVLPETYTDAWLYTASVWERTFSDRKHRLLNI
jgi:hypothetical protein